MNNVNNTAEAHIRTSCHTSQPAAPQTVWCCRHLHAAHALCAVPTPHHDLQTIALWSQHQQAHCGMPHNHVTIHCPLHCQ